MKTLYKAWLSALAMVSITACGTMPYYSQSNTSKRTPKAPVVDRTARRPPQPYPPPQAPIEPLPEEDPLLPREYASADPAITDTYQPTAPVPTYADPGNGVAPQPYPAQPEPTYSQPSPAPYAGAEYRPPSYPPGAAAAPTRRSNTTAPGSLPEPQVAVVPPAAPTIKPPTAPPMPPAPNPVPAAPTGAPAPANATVAMTTPPAASTPEPAPAPVPVARPARPTAPATPPADLPPAEISREGNQAVVALLESADKYVKSKQLDKAGAALERALRIEPRNAGIWYDLAQIRLHQGQYQQAESLATKSNNLAGDNRALQARNWKLIGASRKAAGNRAGAEEAEAHAVQLSH